MTRIELALSAWEVTALVRPVWLLTWAYVARRDRRAGDGGIRAFRHAPAPTTPYTETRVSWTLFTPVMPFTPYRPAEGS
ncbi:hypothetical protein [Streptomyces sp. NPDC088801]|uniref:hypothetical protein n=1 Tax=Streptomyces sp. NPDC088801 TaxID=3365903 RepID=UPI00380C74EB